MSCSIPQICEVSPQDIHTFVAWFLVCFWNHVPHIQEQNVLRWSRLDVCISLLNGEVSFRFENIFCFYNDGH